MISIAILVLLILVLVLQKPKTILNKNIFLNPNKVIQYSLILALFLAIYAFFGLSAACIMLSQLLIILINFHERQYVFKLLIACAIMTLASLFSSSNLLLLFPSALVLSKFLLVDYSLDNATKLKNNTIFCLLVFFAASDLTLLYLLAILVSATLLFSNKIKIKLTNSQLEIISIILLLIVLLCQLPIFLSKFIAVVFLYLIIFLKLDFNPRSIALALLTYCTFTQINIAFQLLGLSLSMNYARIYNYLALKLSGFRLTPRLRIFTCSSSLILVSSLFLLTNLQTLHSFIQGASIHRLVASDKEQEIAGLQDSLWLIIVCCLLIFVTTAKEIFHS